MSKTRLVSGKKKKLTGADLSADRYDYLDVSNAEPDLGLPPVDNSILIGDLDGSRTWADITDYAEEFKGYTGSAGFTGSQGDRGDLGYTGSQGDIGFTGSQGDIGFAGSQGDVGFTGSAGTDGTSGADGQLGYTGSQGDIGYTGSKGVDGQFGGASFYYIFDSALYLNTVLDGHLHLDNASTSLVTFIALADTDRFNTNIASFVQTIDDSTSDIKGYIKLTEEGNPNKFTIFAVTDAHYVHDDHFHIPVSYVSGLTTAPLDNTNVILSFIVNGDKGDTGFTGSQGEIGYTGSAGTDGASGDSGFTGSQGDIGFTGSQGDVGFAGSKGDIGFTGSGGVGFTGSGGTGFTGSQGDTGFTGSGGVGFTGSGGSVGFAGSKGDIGFTGSGGTGFTGSRGFDGSRGDTGFTGSGGIGFTGSQGAVGFTGSGATGATGAAGSLGFTGSRGEQGIQGFTGSAAPGSGGTTLLERHYRKTGVLTVSAGLEKWYIPADSVISSVVARVETAPTGAAIDLLVKVTSTNIDVVATAALSINTGSKISQLYTTPITVLTNQYVTVDIINIGTTVAGENLTVTFTYTRS